jgi:hypothetical protein
VSRRREISIRLGRRVRLGSGARGSLGARTHRIAKQKPRRGTTASQMHESGTSGAAAPETLGFTRQAATESRESARPHSDSRQARSMNAAVSRRRAASLEMAQMRRHRAGCRRGVRGRYGEHVRGERSYVEAAPRPVRAWRPLRSPRSLALVVSMRNQVPGTRTSRGRGCNCSSVVSSAGAVDRWGLCR